METIDIHTHLLAPGVRFDRLFDRISVRLFARRLGQDPRALSADPYGVYRETMARLIGASRHVRQAVLFGVDARCDEQGREVHRDRLCAELHASWPDYGFDGHKGYPTAAHLAALHQHGACPANRRSYAPVRAVLDASGKPPEQA